MRVALSGLTMAEYFRDEMQQDVLLFIDNIFRYVQAGNEVSAMLKNGEIDLLTSASKTPEREAEFAYSSEPIGTSATILTVKAGNTRYSSDDTLSWNGMNGGEIGGISTPMATALHIHGWPAFWAQFAADMAVDFCDKLLTMALARARYFSPV